MLRKPSQGGGLEGTGSGVAPPDLTSDRIKDSLAAARERFHKIAERTKDGNEAVRAEQARVLADAEGFRGTV
jgi:hypothetical protein